MKKLHEEAACREWDCVGASRHLEEEEGIAGTRPQRLGRLTTSVLQAIQRNLLQRAPCTTRRARESRDRVHGSIYLNLAARSEVGCYVTLRMSTRFK